VKIDDLNKEKLKLAQKKENLEKKERAIIQKERKMQLKRLISLGELVVKSGLDVLNHKAIFGALLEIKESVSEKSEKTWALKGSQYLELDKANNPKPLILQFSKGPSADTKKELRSRKFKWNPFRREWYGYGKKEELDEFIKAQNETAQITYVEE